MMQEEVVGKELNFGEHWGC